MKDTASSLHKSCHLSSLIPWLFDKVHAGFSELDRFLRIFSYNKKHLTESRTGLVHLENSLTLQTYI
jgi:hypothetical protein